MTLSVGESVFIAQGQAMIKMIEWKALKYIYYGPCEFVRAHHPRYVLLHEKGMHARNHEKKIRLVK